MVCLHTCDPITTQYQARNVTIWRESLALSTLTQRPSCVEVNLLNENDIVADVYVDVDVDIDIDD
jgi:hypothetical protein